MGARPKEGTACRSGPELAVLGVSDPARLDPYLERRRYAQADFDPAVDDAVTRAAAAQEVLGGWPARSSAAGRRHRLARSLHPILARA